MRMSTMPTHCVW